MRYQCSGARNQDCGKLFYTPAAVAGLQEGSVTAGSQRRSTAILGGTKKGNFQYAALHSMTQHLAGLYFDFSDGVAQDKGWQVATWILPQLRLGGWWGGRRWQ